MVAEARRAGPEGEGDSEDWSDAKRAVLSASQTNHHAEGGWRAIPYQ